MNEYKIEERAITYCDSCGSGLEEGKVIFRNIRTGWDYCKWDCASKNYLQDKEIVKI